MTKQSIRKYRLKNKFTNESEGWPKHMGAAEKEWLIRQRTVTQ